MEDPRRSSPENPDLGPYLLKLARDTAASGGEATKALDYALRASRSFEKSAAAGADLASSLHLVAAIYCRMGKMDAAVAALDKAIVVGKRANHSPVVFSGYMQLGDTCSMLGQSDRAIDCYKQGLKIQMEIFGNDDPRIAHTCRYLAEAHMQAMQFDEADKLCLKALEIHRVHTLPASPEEAGDRRLMALIREAKGDHESALEHLVLASMIMIANGNETEIATIDLSIGNIYSSLARYDEAVFAYQKALTIFKSSRGDAHSSVAAVFIRLADLYHKIGKPRESHSYCENALRIYENPPAGETTSAEEVASGMVELSTIYEAFGEHERALRLLRKARNLMADRPGQRSTAAGIEARIGMMLYTIGRYGESRRSFESAVVKLRNSGEKKSAYFGVVLNQMGLACIRLFEIKEAVEVFEEARETLERERGPCHPDTLGVYSNLAATYDAMGRIGESIEILKYVLKLREEKLGTANPDFDEERKRLAELLKESGKSWNKKTKSLGNLFNPNRTRAENRRMTMLPGAFEARNI
ncbi:protein KINESIN LIGHT CHAIN-RELATED 1-like [Andrographis paniculata]|uniref:protein KINESIN LIGHT CHAIN-RELATED 1-like n=1 Tax=Andrographis paniculata TaxID=175694 RepID=UPI0021E863D1|nr:protein KINESIN LIGHT CHAIN-RELATED 1-like [Andrographis paniculata]